MTCWVPEPNAELVARILDDRRLNAQRGGEGLIIVRGLVRWQRGEKFGWQTHPASVMWRGHLRALAEYQIAMCREWRSRGFQDYCLAEYVAVWQDQPAPTRWPRWWGRHPIHRRHKEWLVARFPEHYRPVWPDVPLIDPEPPLVWPADPSSEQRPE